MNRKRQKSPNYPNLWEEESADYAKKVLNSGATLLTSKFECPTLEAAYIEKSNEWNKIYITFGVKIITATLLAILCLYALLQPTVFLDIRVVTTAAIHFALVIAIVRFALYFLNADHHAYAKQLYTLVYMILINAVFVGVVFFYHHSSIFILSVVGSVVALVYSAYLFRLQFNYALIFHGVIFLVCLTVWWLNGDAHEFYRQAYLFGCAMPVISLTFMSVHQQMVHRRNFLSSVLLQYNNQQLSVIAREDALTAIANRRRFDEYFQHVWSIREQSNALSVLLIDIDSFKKYNDYYGHQLGDGCLREVAMVLNANITRDSDLIARYGGEEFVAVLPKTHERGAITIAENIRKAIQEIQIEHEKTDVKSTVVLTVSIGVATIQSTEQLQSPYDLIEQVDLALYKAKDDGRNQVVHFSEIDVKEK